MVAGWSGGAAGRIGTSRVRPGHPPDPRNQAGPLGASQSLALVVRVEVLAIARRARAWRGGGAARSAAGHRRRGARTAGADHAGDDGASPGVTPARPAAERHSGAGERGPSAGQAGGERVRFAATAQTTAA